MKQRLLDFGLEIVSTRKTVVHRMTHDLLGRCQGQRRSFCQARRPFQGVVEQRLRGRSTVCQSQLDTTPGWNTLGLDAELERAPVTELAYELPVEPTVGHQRNGRKG